MIAILGAMPEEIEGLVAGIEGRTTTRVAGRDLHEGTFAGRRITACFSRWGKVAAAATAAHLASTRPLEALILTGVAGALSPELRVGDLVVGREFYQHDLDASPLFPPMEIPLTGRAALASDPGWRSRLLRSGAEFSAAIDDHVPADVRRALGIDRPRVIEGDVATGDRFVSTPELARAIRGRVPSAACVEMEGAAVAQVCHDFGVPFACARVISDGADGDAPRDFARFVAEIASVFTRGVVMGALT